MESSTPTPEPTPPESWGQGHDPADAPATKLTEVQEAAANLLPSEVPAPANLPQLVGVLLYEAEHGELPPPLHVRFPDHYPAPDNN